MTDSSIIISVLIKCCGECNAVLSTLCSFHLLPFSCDVNCIVTARIEYLFSEAALFYSPVDFTDASDLHQTVVKFIG